MTNNLKHNIENEASVGIYISSFLGTVALFFAGILISRFEVFDESLKMPILYLIVATFGFIFSAIIYANITGHIRSGKDSPEEYIKIGNTLSEYMGLYPFIASIPMVVSSITEDSFLRFSTLLITLLSIFIYTTSKFSLIRRSFSSFTSISVAIFLVATVIVSSISQFENGLLFNMSGAFLLLTLGFVGLIQLPKTRTNSNR